MLNITRILTLVKKSNDKDPKFKVGDHVKISKCIKIFAISYTLNSKSSEKVFVITKTKNIVPWTYVINDLNGKKNCKKFTKKNCKRQI